MNLVAWRMLTHERAKYLGLVFAIAFSTFLLENQTSIFAGILQRTASQILDVTDAEVWVMDPATQYFEETKALRDTDLNRVRVCPARAGRCGSSREFRWHARKPDASHNPSCSDSTMRPSSAHRGRWFSDPGKGFVNPIPW